MIKSMTGFGAADEARNGWRCQVTVRSVNSRYLDVQIAAPKVCEPQDADFRRHIKERVPRGKVRVEVGFFLVDRPQTDFQINREVVDAYIEEAESYFGVARESLSLESLSSILTLPHGMQKVDEAVPLEIAEALLIPTLKKALAAHTAATFAEGKWLAEDVLGNLTAMDRRLKDMQTHIPTLETHYRERFLARLHRELEDGQWDENRVLQEVAIFAEKTDINEEMVRLQSHIQALRGFITSPDGNSKGKKCDFYLQEMNREVNTIGSKIADVAVTESVIELKTLVEKMREQVQNIA